jgi:hypothetical protein
MRPSSPPLLIAALAIEAAFLYIVSIGDLRTDVPRFWSGIFPIFALYLLSTLYILRRPTGSIRLILLCGLLFRLTMWWSPPSLSDDIHRYVWDGRVQLADINPYRYPPEAEEVAHLRDADYEKINHREIPTVYPPLAQLFFRLVSALRPGPQLMKFDLLLCEIGLILLLVAILRQRSQDPRRVLLYAWNPLAIVEIAGSGHIDVLGVFLMMLALFYLAGERPMRASAALAGAFLGKLLPAMLLPLFWRHLAPPEPASPWKRWFALRPRLPLLWFPLLAFIGFLPFLGAGSQLFSGLQTYLRHWQFNDAIPTLLVLLFEHSLPDYAPHMLARGTGTALLLMTLLWTALRRFEPYRATFWIMSAYLLLSPTLHPWYLLWILPFLPLFAPPAWIFLSGLVLLAYQVLIEYSTTGIWTEQAWVKWAQFAPFFLLLIAYPVYQRYRHRSRA